VRVEVARISAKGSIRREMVDTASRKDAARWEELVAEAGLNSPPPYRPAPGQPVYLIEAGEQAFAVAEQDLTGPLRELVMTVLAEGDTT